jgi:hypothetical protein
MNKICQNCKHPNIAEATFCSNCASPLPPAGFGGGQPGFQNQGAYGHQFAQPPGNTGGASQRATAALVLAIAGLFCCSVFTTVPAIFVGWMELNAIKNGQAPPAGKTLAQWGYWIGIVGTVLHLGGGGLWFLLSLLAAASNPYGGY